MFGATRYIAANGSDSNDGLSTASGHPWLHAPGMNGCASNCASYTPQAGDQFIFRGGDTWHRSSGTPVGLSWTWSWSGSNDTTGRIYIGVDKTWYSGASWARPILDLDNGLAQSSCSYPDNNVTAVTFANRSYVTFDNFEFTGACYSGDIYNPLIQWSSATYITVSNNYFHGWSMTGSLSDSQWGIINGTGTSSNTHNTFLGNVIDGSDSTYYSGGSTHYCTADHACSGGGIYNDCPIIVGNIFRYVANAFVCGNFTLVHDNVFDHMYESFCSPTCEHGNILESISGAGSTLTIYNNITSNTNMGVTFWPELNSGSMYVFNNVFFNIGNSANCFLLDHGPQADYFYNNTLDSPCPFPGFYNQHVGEEYQGSATFGNNHYIGYAAFSSTYNNGNLADPLTNNGGHILQSEATANSQGYTSSNNYAPSDSGDATIGAGNDNTTWCNSLPDSDAVIACKKGIGSFSYDSTAHVLTVTAGPDRSSGTWDAGAYQFANAQSSRGFHHNLGGGRSVR